MNDKLYDRYKSTVVTVYIHIYIYKSSSLYSNIVRRTTQKYCTLNRIYIIVKQSLKLILIQSDCEELRCLNMGVRLESTEHERLSFSLVI